MTAAKAFAAAATVLIVFVVGLFGLDVPEEVVTAVGTLLTGAVVWKVRNRRRVPSRRRIRAAVVESSRPSTESVRKASKPLMTEKKASKRRRVDR